MAHAESYVNSLYPFPAVNLIQRYWVTPDVLVGGSIVDRADWEHLQRDFNVQSVLNVETEHSDEDKGIVRLSECRVPDDGTPFPQGLVRQAVSFAKLAAGFGPIYVHCQMGGSRSPAFAYAILRWVHGLTPQQAFDAVRASRDWAPGLPYGDHHYQVAYIASVDQALKS
jgi:protein-tyrosine phosphatase